VFHSIHMSAEDWISAFYIASQVLLFPVLVAGLSLCLRRGALPAGVAIVTAVSALTIIMMEVSHTRRTEMAIIVTMAFVSYAITAVVAVMTYLAIPRAGAAE
jgi:hypothetical protein